MTVVLIVVLLLTAALLFYGLWAWEHIVARRSTGIAALPPSSAPDAPRAFGRDAAWLAVRSGDAEAVLRTLKLRTQLPANWHDGLAAARATGVFVTPVIDGCVLVVGRDLADLAVAELLPLMERLAAAHGSSAWFCTASDLDRHGWALVQDEGYPRAYVYDGEHGVLAWQGEATATELELGCFVDDPRDRSDDDVKWWPDRAIVHALAARWSVDPDRFAGRGSERSMGWVGRLPG